MATFEEDRKRVDGWGFRPGTCFLHGWMVKDWFGDILVDPDSIDENATYVFKDVGSLADIHNLLISLASIQF